MGIIAPALTYLFAEKFGRPGKGNDKGWVEGLVGYARRNFIVPIPHHATWEEFNAHLLAQCRKRRERILCGHKESIGQRFAKDQELLLALPAAPYESWCRPAATMPRTQEAAMNSASPPTVLNEVSTPSANPRRSALLASRSAA